MAGVIHISGAICNSAMLARPKNVRFTHKARERMSVKRARKKSYVNPYGEEDIQGKGDRLFVALRARSVSLPS